MFFDNHVHSEFSNLRLLDATNKIKHLVKRAKELKLRGFAITDHECLSSHVQANKIAKELQKEGSDFKIALGNEIYLTETRESGQKYFHFILLAKNAEGHRQLRELSSGAWYNSYHDRGMERVPTLKEELKNVVSKNPGNLIATTACLGGELSTMIMQLLEFEKDNNTQEINKKKNEIVDFVVDMKELFGSDFYIEVAPSTNKDQVAVNKRMVELSKAANVKLCVGTDAHYLAKKDRFVHKAYLNSKNGEREVDDFYEFSFLMSVDEIRDYLSESLSDEMIDEIISNSNEMADKIEFYDLAREQVIPMVEVREYPKKVVNTPYGFIDKMRNSDSIQDRYWINTCLEELKKKDLFNNQYLKRLNTEAEVVDFISERLGQSLTAYFNTLQSYINLFWECGSILGPGRGSAVGFLSNYLLGITQLDPIKWGLPYWRFLNKDRAEMPKMLGI